MNNKTKNNNNPPTAQYPCRIMTHNVQGLNTTIKQKQILDMMTSHHVDILGLSETKIKTSQSKIINRLSNNFVTYLNNDSHTPNGSGVGIIISKDYAKYVQVAKGYKGRVIHIDLFLRGHVKLRIIQIYLHATHTGTRNEIEQIHSYIYNLLEQARQNKFKSILMGDFNVSYEKYSHEYKRKGTFHWSYDILHKLEHRFNMHDTVQLYHDITTTNPYHTFTPRQQNLSATRIDAIWISNDLTLETISSNNFDPETYDTDHVAVFVSFLTHNIFKRNSHAALKQHNIKKRIFTYDNMTQDKWEVFQQTADAIHDRYGLTNLPIDNTSQLNNIWNLTQSAIMQAATNTIDHHFSSIQHKDKTPQHINEAYEEIRFLNKIIRITATKNFTPNMQKIEKAWYNYKTIVANIASLHKFTINISR
jgi:exonuclease III